MSALPLDEKKRQLLEAKLVDHAAVVANGVITSPPAHQHMEEAPPRPNPDVIVLDSSSQSGSRSSSRLSVKENNRTENSQKARETPPKRPLEFEASDSFDAIRDDKVVKAKRVERIERLDMDSPEPEKLSVAAGRLSSPFTHSLTPTLTHGFCLVDSGSRGAGGVRNTIKNYFHTQNDNPPGAGNASFNHIKEGKESKESKEPKEATVQIIAKDSSLPVTDQATQLMPPPARITPASKVVSGPQQLPSASALELKKQIDMLKLAKDVAESRVRPLLQRTSPARLADLGCVVRYCGV
jgi:hypothetical protein